MPPSPRRTSLPPPWAGSAPPWATLRSAHADPDIRSSATFVALPSPCARWPSRCSLACLPVSPGVPMCCVLPEESPAALRRREPNSPQSLVTYCFIPESVLFVEPLEQPLGSLLGVVLSDHRLVGLLHRGAEHLPNLLGMHEVTVRLPAHVYQNIGLLRLRIHPLSHTEYTRVDDEIGPRGGADAPDGLHVLGLGEVDVLPFDGALDASLRNHLVAMALEAGADRR